MKSFKFLDAVLVCIALFLLAFIVTNEIIFCITGSIPDTLVDKVLDASLIECVVTGLITMTKTIVKHLKGDDDEIFSDDSADDGGEDNL